MPGDRGFGAWLVALYVGPTWRDLVVDVCRKVARELLALRWSGAIADDAPLQARWVSVSQSDSRK